MPPTLDNDAMPCGCVEYHLADCPLVTARFDYPDPYDSGDDFDWGPEDMD